jgi:hypothetical protein
MKTTVYATCCSLISTIRNEHIHDDFVVENVPECHKRLDHQNLKISPTHILYAFFTGFIGGQVASRPNEKFVI